MFDLLLTFYPGIYDSSSWTRLHSRTACVPTDDWPMHRMWCGF